MQFQVPQFIELEDKILGLITMRQFIYVVIAGFGDIFLFMILQIWLWVVITIILACIILIAAFFTYNGKPILILLGQMTRYYLSPHLYLWKHESASGIPQGSEQPTTQSAAKNQLARPLSQQQTGAVQHALHALQLHFLRAKRVEPTAPEDKQ